MFRHELSDFLRDVLDVVAELPRGVRVDPGDYPSAEDLEDLASSLEGEPAEIGQALVGLRAAHCLIEQTVEFEGAVPLVWWTVHPQCAPSRSGARG